MSTTTPEDGEIELLIERFFTKAAREKEKTSVGLPKSVKDKESFQASEKSEETESIFVPNAGLVLLHPYFRHLAERCDALVNESQINVVKLASIFHRLVHPDKNFKEWDQVLTKILLGLRPEDEIYTQEVSSDDLAVIEDLLSSVINHWTALGSTSIQGLREGFLQRPGRLTKEGGVWNLVVEERSYDVLLAQLPWAISIVKTPWMNEHLRVDWS